MAKDASVMSPEARLCFHSLFQATQIKNAQGVPTGKFQFRACLVFSPEQQKTPQFAAMKTLAKDTAVAKFGALLSADTDEATAFRKTFKSPFRLVTEKPEWFEGFDPKSIFINVATDFKPQVFDLDPTTGKACDIAGGDSVYSGCYVRAKLGSYGYNTLGNVGVSFGLDGLQKVKDGERLGGGANAEDFEPLTPTTSSAEGATPAAGTAAKPKAENLDELFQ